MSAILLWDPVCKRDYDTATLRKEALGGSESSLVRIADALDAYVVQHTRVEVAGRYRPPGKVAGVTHVVVSRDSRALASARALYPDARFYLWLYDLVNPGSTRGGAIG